MLASSSAAFTSRAPAPKMQLLRPATTEGLDYAKTLPGITAPFGFFDPLSLTPETKADVLLWRESEIIHGRVSMMAAAGFLVQEGFHPIFPEIGGPAALQLDEVPAPYIVFLLLLPIFQTEVARARKGWLEPDYTTYAASDATVRTLREDYTPGDLGFDPFGYKPADPAEFMEMQNKELNNGRLAMIAIAGMVGQELVTGSALFA